jgi:hypothetical protein
MFNGDFTYLFYTRSTVAAYAGALPEFRLLQVRMPEYGTARPVFGLASRNVFHRNAPFQHLLKTPYSLYAAG